MRSLFAISWLISCKQEPETPHSTLELVEGGQQACPDPSRRDALRYDRRQTPERLPVPEANLAGGGLAIEDYDLDGNLDILILSEQQHEFRWGDGQDFVEDPAVLAGLDLAMSTGATNVDLDADGDPDVLVTRWELPVRLLRNNGDRTFTDITAGSGLDLHATKAQSASWADIDGDDDLDLFIGSYGVKATIDVNEPTPDCSDHIPDYAQLWRNNGDGTFTDIRDLLPPEVHAGYTFMSGFYDLDDDGYPELFTAHDDGNCAGSVLLDNVDGESLVVDAGSGFHPGHHDMGMAVADLNGDELPDFALTSWTMLSVLESLESGLGDNGAIWIESAGARGIGLREDQAYGWGTEFGDLDNDADLDLVATFGYWHYYPNAPEQQRDGLWIQGEDGLFSQKAAEWGVDDVKATRTVVLADLNGDGWLDQVKRVLNDPTYMDLSRCGAESWLVVRLQDEGPNRNGIGARLIAHAGDQKQVRWMQSGSSGMYAGSPLEVHFGLGSAETVDLEIVWPDGERTPMDGVPTRQSVTIRRTRPEAP
jgi:hypothetical protein